MLGSPSPVSVLLQAANSERSSIFEAEETAGMKVSDSIDLITSTSYANFREKALEVYRYQYQNLPGLQLFMRLTGFDPEWPQTKGYWPFLPISFFKHKALQTFEGEPEISFFSSSTTGKGASRHAIKSLAIYEHSFRSAWKHFYPDPAALCILCLLPAYLEREGSSLIYMAEDFLKRSEDTDSGFFLYEHQSLFEILQKKKREGKATLLLGVSYALLDFVENYRIEDFPELIVMETGGMKGRRKEMIREELHAQLCAGFGVAKIHSEYGMTELLSQAYSQGGGVFRCPPWMKVVIKEQNDPFSAPLVNKRGRICIIDLANVFSCAFIETDDLGIAYEDGSFEVLGRLDHSDMRGCNVMVS